MVASDIPCLRARSAVFTPASCSFNTAIICSSVNLARFICPSFFRPDSNSIWRKYAVAGQMGRSPEHRPLVSAGPAKSKPAARGRGLILSETDRISSYSVSSHQVPELGEPRQQLIADTSVLVRVWLGQEALE